ncbi:alpha/beta hydrolase [Dictyobacter alpinus]|uniref:Alpha/beta hydrolase n=1 Tax=Dictyobacter alpinus TaxID=2014873 RepID=A0A402BEW3_9CHLR|nr:alpha/beta hydrolase [Dictyobacter alpinus]GCE29934.1 alpha/beta hydrolase [Dictyobacter alpinus]
MRTPHVVLVHGAWSDGSCWSKVIERLQSAGYTVTAAQIPLTSLADDTNTVRRVLNIQTAPTILVAHAFGGAVITELGQNAPNVFALIYIAAFVPVAGETMKDLVTSGPQPAGTAAIRPDTQGFIWLDRDGFARYFAPDVDPLQARSLAAVQKPIAVSNFLGGEPFGEPAWKLLPCWYLVTERDQMLAPAAQRSMAQRAGATISSIAANHAVMITHPDEVENLIITVAKAI